MNLHNVESEVSITSQGLAVNTPIHTLHNIHKLSSVARDGSGVSEDDGEGPRKRGPEPDRLKIDVPFEEGLRRALEKKRPAHGWPEHDESGEETEGDDGD